MSAAWTNDSELFALCRRDLFTAVVGDVMDIMGYRNQFLPPQIQPLREDMVVIARAMPVLEADDTGGEGPGRANEMMNRPFGLMLRALDDLETDEVYICSGASPDYALWGELMSMAAANRGAPGDIIFGDLDGVCDVPRAMEREVFEAAIQKENGERRVLDAIKGGMGAQEAWDTFGITAIP